MRNGSFTLEAGSNVTFTDLGGIAGNYNNEDKTLTIYPSTAGKKVSVTLTSIIMGASYDSLDFYDGDSTDAPKIGYLVAGASEENPQVITSTADDGSLTIVLNIRTLYPEAGWVGSISEN